MNSLSKVVLSRSAFAHNVQVLRSHLDSHQKICFCVKSNAYGHGFVPMAEMSAEAGVDWLSVMYPEEVRALRQASIDLPILILGYVGKADQAEMIQLGAKLYVWELDQLYALSTVAERLQKSIQIHIPVETGMGRLGIEISTVSSFLSIAQTLPFIEVEGIAHHYATSDEVSSELFQTQQQRFAECLHHLEQEGLLPPVIHSENSAASLLHIGLNAETLVRAGASLYGFAADAMMKSHLQERDITLQPVMSWKTQLISIKQLPAGESIGYGASEILKRDTVAGVIPIGYSDGYDRRLSSKGEVLIQGQPCRVLGRVCMNLTMVDCTEVPHSRIGDEVVVIGTQGDSTCSLEQLADVCDTIPYEICSQIKDCIIEVG